MVDIDVGVILPAAGSGERMGGPIPKQYCKVLDQPLFCHALEAFRAIPYVCRIALVVDNPSHVQALLHRLNCAKVLVVQGERTRHRSIQAGLQALLKQEDKIKVMVVHDAVRPIVPEELVERLVRAAVENGAAGSVCPLISTVLNADNNGFLKTALDRKSHLASETPQAFQTNVLASAYNKCSEEDLECGTECLQLALKYAGVAAQLIEGSPNDLWKVTIRRDLHTASECLRDQKNSVCVVAVENSILVKPLLKSLSSYNQKMEYVMMNNKEDTKQLSRHCFNNVIFFHASQMEMESSLKNITALLDLGSQGLIIHVMEQGNPENFQNMSVYDLFSSGRRMAQHYQKLAKGVVVIYCLDSNTDSESLVTLVNSLLRTNPFSLTGQTFFLQK